MRSTSLWNDDIDHALSPTGDLLNNYMLQKVYIFDANNDLFLWSEQQLLFTRSL